MSQCICTNNKNGFFCSGFSFKMDWQMAPIFEHLTVSLCPPNSERVSGVLWTDVLWEQ